MPRHRCDHRPAAAVPAERHSVWKQHLPRLHTDVPGLVGAFERAGEDLGALRRFDRDHPDEPVIAARAPWYMTLFGREALLTSWMALVLDPGLAMATVRTLARLQGTIDVPDTEEQPGCILHEVRLSRGSSLALAGGDVYYGPADATPLSLWRWGTPLDELRPVLPAVGAALAWLAWPADPDGGGYVEYQRRSPRGLVNQGWKDSFDGASYADGRLSEPPIATAEIQAYAYAAWRAGADLAAAAGDYRQAEAREVRAIDLRDRFDRDFWLPDRNAIALDGDKHPVDAVASNMGHGLWTGIIADHPHNAAAVARWLVSPELFPGWVVRTLATSMARYNPPQLPQQLGVAPRHRPLRRSGCVAPGSSTTPSASPPGYSALLLRVAAAFPSCWRGSRPMTSRCLSLTPRPAHRRHGHPPRP